MAVVQPGRTPGSNTQEGLKRIFATPLTETANYDKEGLGSIRIVGSKVYKWVKYNSGAGAVAAVVGNAAYYFGVGGVMTTGYEDAEVTSDLSDSADIGAGILQAVIANGEFGWIQVRGSATMASAFTAGVDGDAMTPQGSGDGKLDVSAGAADHVCAVATDASAFKIVCDFPW